MGPGPTNALLSGTNSVVVVFNRPKKWDRYRRNEGSITWDRFRLNGAMRNGAGFAVMGTYYMGSPIERKWSNSGLLSGTASVVLGTMKPKENMGEVSL